MRLMCRRSGFSLIEAMVASAVLLLTCAAVSGTLAAVLRAEREVRQRSALEQVLAAERARLASLPFFVLAVPPQGQAPGDLQPSSLLAVVFPHARPEANSSTAFYCDGRGPGTTGSFVTLEEDQGIVLRRETRFVVGGGTEWDTVIPTALEGWAVWAGGHVPATTVEIALSVSSGDRTASTSLLLRALRTKAASPSASAVVGA